MQHITITRAPMMYHNAGQQAQAAARLMYGQSPKADHDRAGADAIIDGRALQIKSNRATVCHGHNIENIATEYAGVDGFLYIVVETYDGYIMTVAEFIAFARAFAEATAESNGKNGGGAKMRLNRQFTAQREWLKRRAE